MYAWADPGGESKRCKSKCGISDFHVIVTDFRQETASGMCIHMPCIEYLTHEQLCACFLSPYQYSWNSIDI